MKEITAIPDDYPMATVRYEGPTAKHTVIGLETRRKYGRKQRGDIFQVHRDDIAAYPQMFTVLATLTEQAPVLPVLPTDIRPAEQMLRPSSSQPEIDEVVGEDLALDGSYGTKTHSSFVPTDKTKKRRTRSKSRKDRNRDKEV